MRTRQPDGDPLSASLGVLNSIAFSPDGTLLAAGGNFGSIALWNARTRQPDGAPLTGHTDKVTSVAFSPDGTLLATGSWDNTIRLWKADKH
ncbi:WD40 repeat domain-containing protein [Nocardia jiangxiensis]|uniref:WD40 repeat domain-containing protein n=1 Tax=Nocardia jiangxiensis TaxID=282685 RepID=A0ABW6SFB8_9NOCA